jgi:outer membrane protein assembly factor BamE (lipoprotein component of BamABCDE complex)
MKFGVWTFAGVVLVMALSGCAAPDRVNSTNYSQIRQDVHTQADVEAILGEPDSRLMDMWVYQRLDDRVTVLIDFDARGRVARKQWVDGTTGAWDDTADKPGR